MPQREASNSLRKDNSVIAQARRLKNERQRTKQRHYRPKAKHNHVMTNIV